MTGRGLRSPRQPRGSRGGARAPATCWRRASTASGRSTRGSTASSRSTRLGRAPPRTTQIACSGPEPRWGRYTACRSRTRTCTTARAAFQLVARSCAPIGVRPTRQPFCKGSTRGRARHRPARDGRVRYGAARLQSELSVLRQPMESGLHSVRLVERLGCRDRRAHGAWLARLGYGRLDPLPGCRERCRGLVPTTAASVAMARCRCRAPSMSLVRSRGRRVIVHACSMCSLGKTRPDASTLGAAVTDYETELATDRPLPRVGIARGYFDVGVHPDVLGRRLTRPSRTCVVQASLSRNCSCRPIFSMRSPNCSRSL